MGEKVTEGMQSVPGWQKPQIFNLAEPKDAQNLAALKAEGRVHFVSDQINSALEELYHIENPSQIDSIDHPVFQKYIESHGNLDEYGSWVYYPWNGNLVHFPPAEDLSRLRGSRNRNLITDEERLKLASNKTILILGLSVGSNVVDSLLMQGIGSRYVLVDMDSLDPTNLNRIRAGYDQLGVHKVDLVAKKISELNPYAQQMHYKDGINEDNVEQILTAAPPHVIIDEMDSLRMKIVIRQEAKKSGIPIIMATDNGDDILLDIERFDQDKELPLLHGILPQEVIQQILDNKQMSRQEAGALIGRYFVNLDNVPVRMIESLMQVGKTLPSWPQLGGAAVLSGLYAAYAAKRILLGLPLNPGRFLMGPEAQLNPELQEEDYKTKKAALIRQMTGQG